MDQVSGGRQYVFQLRTARGPRNGARAKDPYFYEL
jgi:hypothetical protein